MKPDELEKRLSSLKLSEASPSYYSKGQSLIAEYSGGYRHSLSRRGVYLNYALALSLLMSLGINILQLMQHQQEVQSLTAQCDIDKAYHDADMPPLISRNPAALHTAQPAFPEREKLRFC